MPKKGKAGNPRKSRRKRLNISGGTGPEEKFSPHLSDWRRVETAYGHNLSDDDRRAIVVLVDKYFFWQPSESAAPFVDDALRYLNRLEKTGRKFWETMLEREQIPTLIGEARLRADAIVFVQNHVGRYLAKFDFRKKTDWDGLIDVMGASMAAFIKAREYINGDSANRGFVEGNAWNNFVWGLSEFAEQRQLPFRISKSDDPARASPFIRFFRELQESFPPRFRRHHSSYTALAEAITVARRQIRSALARREARKIISPDQPA